MPIVKLPKPPKQEPSPQQLAIWDHLTNSDKHLVVVARAGTGKTTTLVKGLNRIPANLWTSTYFVAFNRSIAKELQQKVPPGVSACTLHSFGYAMLRRAYGDLEVTETKTGDIVRTLYSGFRENHAPWKLLNAVERLVSLCKGNLVGNPTREDLQEAMEYHDIDPGNYAYDALNLVPQVLSWACKIGPDICEKFSWPKQVIDYDDMIWLPVVHSLPEKERGRVKLMAVDESQDLNLCQQELVWQSAERIMLIGDPRQAIYGFRGADTKGMERMTKRLAETERGVETLPLTVTWRVPLTGVTLAQSIVKDLEAAPKAIRGTVQVSYEAPSRIVKPGDMVLCRINAPLVSLCFELIRQNVPARIQGRDIGKDMRRLVNMLASQKPVARPEESTAIIQSRLDQYHQAETARLLRKKDHEAKLAALNDRVECLEYIMEGCVSIEQVFERIDNVFTDVEPDGRPRSFVLLSSVHKAKGLEADNVFIHSPHKMPLPFAKQPWEQEQEMNVIYVAITRHKKSLTFFDDIPGCLMSPFLKIQSESDANGTKPEETGEPSGGLLQSPQGERPVSDLSEQDSPKGKARTVRRVPSQKGKAAKDRKQASPPRKTGKGTNGGRGSAAKAPRKETKPRKAKKGK